MSNAAATPSGEVQCPCCNNPWSKSAQEMFSQLCAMCEETKGSKSGSAPALDPANLDPSVAPRDDFYRHANGGWIASNPIPTGYPNWNSFLQLHVQSQERMKDILAELADGTLPESKDDEERRKVADFYAAALDEDRVEEFGAEPLRPLLEDCASVAASLKCKDWIGLARKLGGLKKTYGRMQLFGVGAGPDAKRSAHSICQISQGGLGLPDRDCYFDDDKAEQREAYIVHVAKMLRLLDGAGDGDSEDEYKATALRIFDMEKSLAEAHMTKTENRDPHATYNKMTVDDMTQQFASNGTAFDFGVYLEAATGKAPSDLGEVNVRNVEAVKKVVQVLTAVDAETFGAYLRWKVITSHADYLPKAFVDEDFDFFQRTLSGTKEQKPRWKRAITFTEGALGEALGKIYCARHFDESSKAEALKVVESVRAALEERLKEVEWMTSDETRKSALEKMVSFKTKIGYPDEWIDYSALEIDAKMSLVEMIFASRRFDFARAVREMNAPTDRKKWFMYPQTVNAYYHPSLNEIVFPSAILQPPFFHPGADPAVNYGAMGAVVGHEMTHGFDDSGRKYDADGNMRDWWTKEDGEEYEKRVAVMVSQADAFLVHDRAVKGKLTCGENIADLGGLRLAYRALRSRPAFAEEPRIDGFTQTQRFFLSWAQCWRQNITKERSLQLITLDPHGPNEMRTNGPLSNMGEFHAAFAVPEDSPMYRKKEHRVDIW
ncbi:hypothetical protein ACHAWF_013765 [Thalassiosira exigua]